MKLTMQLIVDSMEEYHGTLIPGTKGAPGLWYQVMWYNPEAELYDDVIYFGRTEDFLPEIRGKGLICIGAPAPSLRKNNEILCFGEVVSLEEVFVRIQSVFHRFHRWEYDDAQGGYILPLDILNDFKVNEDYLATMHTTGPSVFPAETFGYAILYQNLWYNKKYRGRICVNEIKRRIRPGDFYLLDFFSGIVLEVLKAGEGLVMNHAMSLSRVLFQMLEGEQEDMQALDRALLQYGWTAKDDYFCVCFFSEERDIHTNSVQYFCSRLMDHFPDSCAFLYEKCVVMLVNSTLSDMNPGSFGNRIAVMLREGLMKAGISALSSDLQMFPLYYEQAVCAYETGQKINDTFWSYRFEDYQMDFVLENALEKLPASLLCSPEILRLREYDATHTAELSRTLKIYLEQDRNLARTAEILQIHRSTLLYRIGRIKEMTGLELEEPREKFRLLLSYYLIEQNRGQA